MRTDERDPRALGADSLSSNSGELWALAEAFLCLRDESGDDRRFRSLWSMIRKLRMA